MNPVELPRDGKLPRSEKHCRVYQKNRMEMLGPVSASVIRANALFYCPAFGGVLRVNKPPVVGGSMVHPFARTSSSLPRMPKRIAPGFVQPVNGPKEEKG